MGIPLLLMLAGGAVLPLSVYAWIKNRRVRLSALPQVWRTPWRLRWISSLVLGIALGIGCVLARYTVESGVNWYSIRGVPFVIAAFDRSGHDYVGPLSAPALLLNFITGVLVPQLFYWLISFPLKSMGRVAASAP